jgi:hypothetical protein
MGETETKLLLLYCNNKQNNILKSLAFVIWPGRSLAQKFRVVEKNMSEGRRDE